MNYQELAEKLKPQYKVTLLNGNRIFIDPANDLQNHIAIIDNVDNQYAKLTLKLIKLSNREINLLTEFANQSIEEIFEKHINVTFTVEQIKLIWQALCEKEDNDYQWSPDAVNPILTAAKNKIGNVMYDENINNLNPSDMSNVILTALKLFGDEDTNFLFHQNKDDEVILKVSDEDMLNQLSNLKKPVKYEVSTYVKPSQVTLNVELIDMINYNGKSTKFKNVDELITYFGNQANDGLINLGNNQIKWSIDEYQNSVQSIFKDMFNKSNITQIIFECDNSKIMPMILKLLNQNYLINDALILKMDNSTYRLFLLDIKAFDMTNWARLLKQIENQKVMM